MASALRTSASVEATGGRLGKPDGEPPRFSARTSRRQTQVARIDDLARDSTPFVDRHVVWQWRRVFVIGPAEVDDGAAEE